MNVQSYMQQMAEHLGAIYAPKCKTFTNDYTSNLKGALFAVRSGYLIALALVKSGNSTAIRVLVRYPKTATAPQIQEAIKSRAGFSGFLTKKSVKASETGVLVAWGYAFKKTKIEDVVAIVDGIIEEVSKYAPAFNGKCEDCSATETREIVLMNGVPGYHCPGCQMRSVAEKQREAEEYRAGNANYAMGAVVGIVAAAVVGLIWGFGVSLLEADSGKWSPKFHAVITFLLSAPVCWVMFKAMGKKDRFGQVLGCLLTLGAKWFGDAIYFAHVIAHADQVPFTWQMLTPGLKDFFALKSIDGMHIFVTICDVAIAAAVPWMPWGKLPKFVPAYQSVQPDGSLTQSMAAGAP